MADSDPATPEPAPEPATETSQAQDEFAQYKLRMEQAGASAGAPFASPLSASAVPAWSLQRPAAGPGPDGHGPAPSGTSAARAGGSIVDGVGTTIRLGVEALNAALSSGLQMLNGVGDAVGWGQESCDCEECNPGGPVAYDCCSVMGCGGGCCEPSVGSCC